VRETDLAGLRMLGQVDRTRRITAVSSPQRIALGAIVVLAASAALVRSRMPRPPLAPVEASPVPTPPPATAATLPAKAAFETLTTEQIAKRALRSVVALQCEGIIGAGFFVAEDLVVTNAHVTCAGKKTITVRLNDGREVLGLVKSRDPWIDFATIEVIASNVPPLRLADPLALEPGAHVVAVGSPKGLDFSVSEGTASFIGRNLFGVGYVQFNAPINPGNSGGPLLDSTGAVVGIVTLKQIDAEGIAFALPVWYVRPPEDPDLFARWHEFLGKIAEKDAAERAKVLEKLLRPTLLDLTLRHDGLNALLGQSRSELPQPGRVELQIEQETEQCLARGTVARWVALDELAKHVPELPRRMEWLVRSGDAKNLYYGLAPLDLSACRLSERPARVRFEGADPITVPGNALLTARNISQTNEAIRRDWRR
jgi:serine protease Do